MYTKKDAVQVDSILSILFMERDLLVATAALAAIAALALTAATAAVTAAAATAHELSEILRLCVAYVNYSNLEVQSLACHRVVEVHHNGLLLNLLNEAHHVLTISCSHRNLAAYEQNLLRNLAVHHKYALWQLNDGLSDNLAVTIFSLQGE